VGHFADTSRGFLDARAKRASRPVPGPRRPGRHQAADRWADLIDPDRVFREAARLAFSNVGELFDKHGRLRPLDELSDDSVVTMASIKVARRRVNAGPHPMVIVQKVELWGKLEALELLLTHFALLQERRQLKDESALLARLDSGRR
jgi:Terminase small subunit